MLKDTQIGNRHYQPSRHLCFGVVGQSNIATYGWLASIYSQSVKLMMMLCSLK